MAENRKDGFIVNFLVNPGNQQPVSTPGNQNFKTFINAAWSAGQDHYSICTAYRLFNAPDGHNKSSKPESPNDCQEENKIKGPKQQEPGFRIHVKHHYRPLHQTILPKA
ncbi:MAG: hypothetical protein IIC07_03455 [Proteobacteria bacterium]|nr:hypothetical protein [Pseudomonadota bacterium]